MGRLDSARFERVVEDTPLVSIDLIIRNCEGEVLLGKRTRRPAKGMWFVPGGRIRKDEPVGDAFQRLCREELGVSRNLEDACFMGVYEHFYPDNFSDKDFTTHYVVLGYRMDWDVSTDHLPRNQHDAYKWWSSDRLLASVDVHPHSKWYLQTSSLSSQPCGD